MHHQMRTQLGYNMQTLYHLPHPLRNIYMQYYTYHSATSADTRVVSPAEMTWKPCRKTKTSQVILFGFLSVTQRNGLFYSVVLLLLCPLFFIRRNYNVYYSYLYKESIVHISEYVYSYTWIVSNIWYKLLF